MLESSPSRRRRCPRLKIGSLLSSPSPRSWSILYCKWRNMCWVTLRSYDRCQEYRQDLLPLEAGVYNLQEHENPSPELLSFRPLICFTLSLPPLNKDTPSSQMLKWNRKTILLPPSSYPPHLEFPLPQKISTIWPRLTLQTILYGTSPWLTVRPSHWWPFTSSSHWSHHPGPGTALPPSQHSSLKLPAAKPQNSNATSSERLSQPEIGSSNRHAILVFSTTALI